jgi:hypothetical protein
MKESTMPEQKKSDRNYKLIEYLIAGHSTVEAAKEFGISNQRVNQLVKYYKLDLRTRKTNKEILFEKITPFLGTMRDTDIARKLGVSLSQVRHLREKQGVKAYSKPIGCAKCKTEPWAKGMCRNCYERSRRRLRKYKQGSASKPPDVGK